MRGEYLHSSLTVQWNGIPLSTTLQGNIYLRAAVPATLIASPGTARITVLDVDGSVYEAGTFTIGTAPTITNSLPLAMPTGSPAFTLTVNGTGYTSGSVVKWNGLPLATVLVSAEQLTATVPAELIANEGTANITVVNPDGSVATTPAFFTAVGRPTINMVSPGSTYAGREEDLQILVGGTGFFSSSVVQWNGTPLTTTYKGDILYAVVPADLKAAPTKPILLSSIPEERYPTSSHLRFSVRKAPQSVK